MQAFELLRLLAVFAAASHNFNALNRSFGYESTNNGYIYYYRVVVTFSHVKQPASFVIQMCCI